MSFALKRLLTEPPRPPRLLESYVRLCWLQSLKTTPVCSQPDGSDCLKTWRRLRQLRQLRQGLLRQRIYKYIHIMLSSLVIVYYQNDTIYMKITWDNNIHYLKILSVSLFDFFVIKRKFTGLPLLYSRYFQFYLISIIMTRLSRVENPCFVFVLLKCIRIRKMSLIIIIYIF